MTISASMVKDLREKTGAGMMDCKKALSETNGDLEAAVTYLREKGLAAAAKKAGRVAAEGLVGVYMDGGVAGMVEVNCETDFVAKNEDFQKFVDDLAKHVVAHKPADLDALLGQSFGDGKTVKDAVTAKVSTIGENINLRRFWMSDSADAYGSYMHGGGKIGVVVALKLGDSSKASNGTVDMLARDLAMHVASEGPLAIDQGGIDPAVVEHEKNIFIAQAKEQGKPDEIIEKMVVGKVNKFLAENCLLDQAFVKDPDMKVKKLIDKTAAELGTTITVAEFARFKVGEGIEKKEENFAEEVAKMTGA